MHLFPLWFNSKYDPDIRNAAISFFQSFNSFSKHQGNNISISRSKVKNKSRSNFTGQCHIFSDQISRSKVKGKGQGRMYKVKVTYFLYCSNIDPK